MDELKPIDAEAARLYACGKSQSEAYRLTHPGSRAKPESIHELARRLFAKIEVGLRVDELLREARVEDILSVGEHMRNILEDREAAKADRNHTAVATNNKTLAQILGMTSNTLVLSVEKSQTDEELIASLAQGDEHKAAMLRAIIGKDSFA